MALIQSDTVTVAPGSATVTFPTPMASTDYVVVWSCVSSSDPTTTVACTVNSSLFTVNGFQAVVSEEATFRYIATESGLTFGLLPPTGKLSRDWTALKLWSEAVRDLGVEGDLLHFERFNLINRSVNAIAKELFPLFSNAYTTEQSVTQSSNKISLSGLRFVMAGEGKLIIESTSTTTVKPLSREAFNVWRSTAFQNIKSVVWNYTGDYLYLNKGSSLSTYGTLTLRYPRVPVPVTGDSDYLDVPDSAMEIVILKLKTLLAPRVQKPVPEAEAKMTGLIQSLYGQLGVQATLEEIQDKTKRIL